MLLSVKDLTKSFFMPGSGEKVEVIRNVTLDVARGETVAITGPSGSGKSTLLNLLGGLDRPSGGSVHLEDKDLASLSDREISSTRNRKIGFVFQLHHLLPQCTVIENAVIPALAENNDVPADTMATALALLDRVGLSNRLEYRPARLSGGERQRVAVVRAMVNSPSLILADEPTGSLDEASAEALMVLLAELNSERDSALVVVTHSTRLAGLMDTQYGLAEGKLTRK